MKNSLFKIFSAIQPFSKYFVLGLLGAFGGAALNTAIPTVARGVINRGLTNLEVVSVGMGQLLILFLLQGIFSYIRILYLSKTGILVAESLRNKAFSSLVRKSITYFDSAKASDIASRLTADIQILQDLVSIKLSVCLRYGVQIIFGVALMVWLAPRLSLFVLIAILVLVAISFVLGRALRKCSRVQQEALSFVGVVTDDVVAGIRSIRILKAEKFLQERFKNAAHTYTNAAMKRTGVSAWFQSGVSFLLYAFLVLLVMYGVFLVSRGDLSAGDLTGFLMYGALVAVSFALFVTGYAELSQSLGGAERIFDLIERESSDPIIPDEKDFGFSFERVSFSYPGRDEKALSDLSLMIEPKKWTAFVGPSGAGKSSIIQLISGFYTPTSGSINILGDLNFSESQSLLSYMPQDPWVFTGTLRENLALGRDTSEEEVREILHALDLSSLLAERGLDTELGPKGAQLSGGQRQRISAARALLKPHSTFLMMDEPTSSLDAENERILMEEVHKRFKGKTVVSIAHRIASVKNADKIYVISEGAVVASGNHESLMNSPGIYRELATLQGIQG